MFQDIAAVGDVAVVIGEREVFAEADPVVDVETHLPSVGACRFKRDLGRVDTDHVASQLCELLGHEPSAAADVKGAQAIRGDTEFVENLAKVGDPARGEASVQDVQRVVLIPPVPALAVIDLVVDGHLPPPGLATANSEPYNIKAPRQG